MPSLRSLRTSPFYRLSCLSLGVSLLFVAACADDDDSPSTTDTGTNSGTVTGTTGNTDVTNTGGQTTGNTSGTGDVTESATPSTSKSGDTTTTGPGDTSNTTGSTGGDTQDTGDGTDPTTSGTTDTNDTDGTTSSTGTNACSQIPDTDECITCMKASPTCCALADECWQDEAGCKCLINCLIETQDAEACQMNCEPPSDSLKLQALVCYAGCQSQMLCPGIDI